MASEDMQKAMVVEEANNEEGGGETGGREEPPCRTQQYVLRFGDRQERA
jgi:hypothetical protein